MISFFSHGKLLISGEYLVLVGGKAFAIPTEQGQRLSIHPLVSELSKVELHWTAFDHQSKPWFRAIFKGQELVELQSNDSGTSKQLRKILLKAKALNPDWNILGHSVETHLEFPKDWGLGSSSTLLCNIAKWAEVDAFELSDASFGGSGVDIAVGMLGSELIYERPPAWNSFVWNPSFADQLWFVHLNRKQNSRESIASFNASAIESADIEQFNLWTEELVRCEDLDSFQFILSQHENRLSQILGRKTIKALYFPDYPQAIKSLGGWGGDFVLAVGSSEQMNYFREKGFNTIIPLKEMRRH